eukprot:2990063-Pyramimonas_sp.AAC.1
MPGCSPQEAYKKSTSRGHALNFQKHGPEQASRNLPVTLALTSARGEDPSIPNLLPAMNEHVTHRGAWPHVP